LCAGAQRDGSKVETCATARLLARAARITIAGAATTARRHNAACVNDHARARAGTISTFGFWSVLAPNRRQYDRRIRGRRDDEIVPLICPTCQSACAAEKMADASEP